MDDWSLLLSMLPTNWRKLAEETNALKGLRQDKSEENLLRTLLIHLGCGYSLRETVVRAREEGLADLSDVALMKRLKKSGPWLQSLCQALLKNRNIKCKKEFSIRLFDGTHIKEPGKTGSLWRIHYSFKLPAFECDYFKLTQTKGVGTGESFMQYQISKGDYIFADRAYSTAKGIKHIESRKAFVTVRVNTGVLNLHNLKGKPLQLLSKLKKIKKTGTLKSWDVIAGNLKGDNTKGRICIIRKSKEAIKKALKKIKREASKDGHETKPETLIYAEFVILFTTFPEEEFSLSMIMEWYRIRWQVELVFKRFKQIAQLGHLRKYDDESSKAWIYGKMLVALITEELVRYAESVSPWGYQLEKEAHSKLLA